ncbi:MAG: hypothetical protein ACRD9L_02490 [Bryobacteraceae bacterium]
MNHPNEEQLVLYYYGEAGEVPNVEEHLASCEGCRAAYHSLQRVLNTVDLAPLPPIVEEYGAQVWQRLEPLLAHRRARRRSPWFAPRRWVPAGALAALVVAAFLAGRWRPAPPPPPVEMASGAQVRERVLLVALGDHLERSQMMLVELANSEPVNGKHKGKLDISYERSAAEDLLESNRLYRQTALRAGNVAAANVLDDLERVLLEVAHSPASVSTAQLDDLRKEIEEQGILFKVKIFGSRVRELESPSKTGADNL